MLEWSHEQQGAILEALGRFPRASNKCARLARALLPIATALDADARALLVEPSGFALYVQPKGGPARWMHHVTTSVQAHCVDVLTGVAGHPEGTYLEAYFEHPTAHLIRPVEDDDWEEL